VEHRLGQFEACHHREDEYGEARRS